jgi:hypothetical protein
MSVAAEMDLASGALDLMSPIDLRRGNVEQVEKRGRPIERAAGVTEIVTTTPRVMDGNGESETVAMTAEVL